MENLEQRYMDILPKGGVAISNSLVKNLGYYVIEDNIEEEGMCPRQQYYMNIKKAVDKPESDAMLYGKYLEQKLIGSTMDHEHVELPRHKTTGEKLVTEQRIDAQSMRFPVLCNKHDVRVTNPINTQVPIVKHIRDNFYGVGTLDLFPTTKRYKIDEEDVILPAIIDIKGTKSLFNDRFDPNMLASSLSCWGMPKKLNISQALFYKWLTTDIDISLNKHLIQNFGWDENFFDLVNRQEFVFFYWVFSFGKDVDGEISSKFFQPKWTETRQQLIEELVETAIQAYKHYEENKWPANPGRRCERCPLSSFQCIHKKDEQQI